jgi:acetyl-CoA carboxylase biotin carboxyl carrier protein
MDLRKLKKLIDLVEESGITELEITEGEEKVRIVKSPAHASQKSHLTSQNASATLSPEDSEPLAKTKSAAKVVKLDAKTDSVKAE